MEKAEKTAEVCEVSVDFNLGSNNYFVDLNLSINKMLGEKLCSICESTSFVKPRPIREIGYLITDLYIREIREVKSAPVIALDSEKGLQIEQHIKNVLLNPNNSIVTCKDCLTLLWLLLDKKNC